MRSSARSGNATGCESPMSASSAAMDGQRSSRSSLYQARLLGSIDECLGEALQQDAIGACGDATGRAGTGRADTNSTDNLNLSMLFDDVITGTGSSFNIRGCSLEGLSAFNSSFFASQERLFPRCLGDTTISDLGNSRYSARLLEPVTPTWPAYGTENRSIDTLPEYVPRAELPPPYLVTPLASQESPGRRLPHGARHMGRSRANLDNSSTCSIEQWGSQTFPSVYQSQPAMPYDAGAISGRPLADSREALDIRHFPRRMC
ncbi:hypothetical protein LPJ61_001387 [Coemansia biformis]|uniref:Uncharacterized protein n=1 Tax=Coemansia biformis TaxID=1286918 RepID=A0A9W7YEZ7_9FUNG|nr:hypothetical protein LPJ61_001387 [Coemansia biformis]